MKHRTYHARPHAGDHPALASVTVYQHNEFLDAMRQDELVLGVEDMRELRDTIEEILKEVDG